MHILSEKEKTDLRNRLQFAVVLALFFPLIFSAALKTGTDAADHFTIQWGIVVVLLIINYFLIESLETLAWNWVISMTNALMFIEIAMFAVVIYGLAATQTLGSISYWWVIPLGTSFIGLIAIPFVSMMILGANSIYRKSRNRC